MRLRLPSSLFTPRNPIKTPLSLFRSDSSLIPVSLFSHSWRSSRMAIPPKLLSSSSSSLTTATTSTATTADQGLAAKLWIKFRRESVFAIYTPFVVALASGNLNIDSFRHYISQDFHFLKSFAHAYELSEECADDDDAKLVIAQLRKDVMRELKFHNSFIQEWGLDPAKEGNVNSATIKYTDFLLATASGKVEGVKGPGKLATPFERTKVAAYTLGAMTPCMRLYAFLGKELLALIDSEDGGHPYKKWIDSYSSEGFQASALQTEDLLDKLSVPLTGEELDIIEKLYYQAMKLEIEFFNVQPLAQPVVVPLTKEHNPAEDRLVIFSDFDLTCTVVDSSAILAEIAIVTAPKSDQVQPENQIARMPSAELRNTWDIISGQYTEEYEQCIERLLPSEKVEFNYEALCKALEQLSDFERRANSRVIGSGVLKGLNLEDIKRAGERLILQEGCTSFFQKLVKNESLNANVHVLSYCWCADLIRSAFSSGGLDTLSIHANEFTYEESISTGEIDKKVESPIDKAQAFNSILKNYSTEKKNLTVYIGDSVGDLLCLLQADIGIVIGSSSSLRRVGSQFGVSFLPLFPGLVKKQKEHTEGSSFNWKGQSGILYTVSSWAEIHAFILGW
ncbi:bifunctional TH2 protein, mitochondrial [Ricinus communis]|uniref:bifunctional TH2 protein, mitochondrial n=1 Tax=Ricinus communis TaxID=3988 RepID=UPI00201B1926|nr:bifunctional TH2 protein, mitochondrial [Ricinus communis]